MSWKGGDISMIKKKKGIVTSIQGKKAIAMTKDGEFIKVNLPQGVDVGSEIEFYQRSNLLPLNREQAVIILATITANSPEISIDENEIGTWVSERLHKHELLSNVLVYTASKEDRQMAQEQKKSPIKYILIKKIEEEGIVVTYTQEELIEINVRDLAMIINSKEVPKRDTGYSE